MTHAIGIDIGGTNVKALCVREDGAVVERTTFGTEDAKGTAWATRVKEQIDKLCAAHRADAVGIAAPGMASRDQRSIAWMRGRLDFVQGLDWTTHLGSDRLIPVLNDAHAALLGEVWKGAAAGAQNVVMLTLGTGVGGAAMVDGVLLRGHLGRAGHLGHITVDSDGPLDIVKTPGSLEDAIGNCTIQSRSGGRFDSTEALVAAYRSGDAEASAIWLRSMWQLTAGLASLINVLDPQVIILGGGVAHAGAALFDPLKQYLDRVEWRPTEVPVRIVPAQLGEWAGAFGAANNAIKNLKPQMHTDAHG